MFVKRRNFFLAPLAAVRLHAAAAERPNLVLFLSDDHGLLDTPLYGSRVVRTPQLSRIAREGAVFENVFTGAAICIPSRAILASGLCSHRNGAIANGREMTAGIKTLPSYLREAGYRVAHFGKSHFVPRDNYKDWEWVKSEIRGEGPLNNDLDTAAFDNWLASRDPADKRPLCLIVCSHSPHVYWEPNQGYDPAQVELPPTFVDTPETRQWRCRYYTDVTKMDQQLGEVYAAVRKRMSANTLFLYTSDNGAQWPFAKWNLYDAGVHMPMAASWPGVLKPGSRIRAMIDFADFLPTFLELAGVKPPADIDGRSFAAVLRGRTDRRRTEVFASHTADNHSAMNCYPMRSVRTDRFRYIWNLRPDLAFHTHFDRGKPEDGAEVWRSWVERAKKDERARAIVRRYYQRPEEELYDLSADPHETTNLAGKPEYRRTLAELRAKVRAWMDSMGDKGELFGVPRPLSSEQLPV
jgi:N-sulfoglucosamine sulfohydrolase